MPSKNGFGNSRTPLTKKAQYGVDQKNPILRVDDKKKIDLSKKSDAELKKIYDRQRSSTSDSSNAVINQHLQNWIKGGNNSNNKKEEEK
jgi:predicted RNA-binding protein with RPS1 domain